MKKSTLWGLAALLFSAIVAINILFYVQFFTFNAIYLLSVMAVAAFVSSFVFVSKRNWWTLLVVCIVGLWAVASALYLSCNNTPLRFEEMLMAGNLRGVESSIGIYWNSADWGICIVVLLYALLLPLFPLRRQKSRSWKQFGVVMAFSVIAFAGHAVSNKVRYEREIAGQPKTQMLANRVFLYLSFRSLRTIVPILQHWLRQSSRAVCGVPTLSSFPSV